MDDGSAKKGRMDGVRSPVVVIGLGQLGQTFAKGFLRLGRPVYPVTRGDSLEVVATQCCDPELVVVAVGEKELGSVLDNMPSNWKDRLVLLQNELLPSVWKAHNIESPTVFVCWYEQKQHESLLQPAGAPSQAHGAHAQLVIDAHEAIGIKCCKLSSEEDLLEALVAKCVLIQVINTCGLALHHIKEPFIGGNFGQLLTQHRDLFNSVSQESFALQKALSGKDVTVACEERVMSAVLRMMESVPDHRNCGRTASERLQKALETAERLGVSVPAMRHVWEQRQAHAWIRETCF